jgi:hypothetical protein
MANKLCVVYRTAAAHKAHLLSNILADYEVLSHVGDINVANEIGGSHQAIEVRVTEDHLELATRIVESFERNLNRHADPEDVEEEEPNDADFPRIWVDWPVCDRCGQPRETSCQFCSSISSNFELADQEWSDGDEQSENEDGKPTYPLLICHTCSEPFEPTFYRHCAQCNLDLGHGEPAPDLELTPSPAFLSPAIFGWLLIILAALILWMASTT